MHLKDATPYFKPCSYHSATRSTASSEMSILPTLFVNNGIPGSFLLTHRRRVSKRGERHVSAILSLISQIMSVSSSACFSYQTLTINATRGALGRSVVHLRSRTAPPPPPHDLNPSPDRQPMSHSFCHSIQGRSPAETLLPLQRVPTRCWNERENTPIPWSTLPGMPPRGHSTRRPPTGMFNPDISSIPPKTPSTWQGGTLRHPDGATSLVPCCRACLTCGLPTSLPRNREIQKATPVFWTTMGGG